MKRTGLSSVLDRAGRIVADKKVVKAAKIAAAGATSIWLMLRVRKELYGPGGTKLDRHRRRD